MMDRTNSDQTSQSKLGLQKWIIDAARDAGLDSPTELQCQVIPKMLEGNDLLVRAGSGDGKTASYLLPIIQQIDPGQGLQALILVPDDALAKRVMSFLGRLICKDELVYDQATSEGLDEDVDVAVMALDDAEHLDVDLSQVRFVVADELERMAEPDQIEAIQALIERTADDRQVAIIAADRDDNLLEVAGQFASDPVQITRPPRQAGSGRDRRDSGPRQGRGGSRSDRRDRGRGGDRRDRGDRGDRGSRSRDRSDRSSRDVSPSRKSPNRPTTPTMGEPTTEGEPTKPSWVKPESCPRFKIPVFGPIDKPGLRDLPLRKTLGSIFRLARKRR